jgi:hypothetical protein
MPKIPNMRWGAVTNLSPTLQTIHMLDQALKHDHKWHTVLDTKHSTIIDGIAVVKKSKESMS